MQSREPRLIRHFVRSAQLRADLLHDGYLVISETALDAGRIITFLRHQRNGRRLKLEISAEKTTLYEGTKILKQLEG